MYEVESIAEARARLKTWIIDRLDSVTKNNLDFSIGVVSGMERVYTFLLGGDAEHDPDIKAAYEMLDLRIPN